MSKDDTGEHDRPHPSDLAEMFARLYDEHAPALQRYLARRIGPETADDLVAETFLAAMTGYAGYDPTQPIRPWLYGIATNKLRRHLRQERRRYQATARLAARDLSTNSHDAAVADALGIPIGTVRSRLHRVRKSLRTSQGGSDATTVE
jgi:RNA polymerase sigma-70 factor (ECF subfamily)